MTDVGQWRADPSGRHQYRWWDGNGWTDRVSDRGLRSLDADVKGPPPSPRARARRHTGLSVNAGGVVTIAGAAAAIVGTFLTMTTVQVAKLSSTTTYWDADDGKIVAGMAAGVLLVAILGLLRPSPNGMVVGLEFAAAAAVAGIALYDRIDLDNTIDTMKTGTGNDALGQIVSLARVTIGPGLYVCVAGGVIAAIGALFAASRR